MKLKDVLAAFPKEHGGEKLAQAIALAVNADDLSLSLTTGQITRLSARMSAFIAEFSVTANHRTCAEVQEIAVWISTLRLYRRRRGTDPMKRRVADRVAKPAKP